MKQKQEMLLKIMHDLSNIAKDKNKASGIPIINQYAIIFALVNQNCWNSLHLYDQVFTLQDELLRLRVKNSQLEEEADRLAKSTDNSEQALKTAKEQISILKCKNSRLFQEIGFLQARAGYSKEYMNYTQEQVLKENESLKKILNKSVPFNEELIQSLSFYKIQYHLLKKKFANISTATQQKNIKALEESLAQAQYQLLESEAYQHYLSLGDHDEVRRILLEEICECKNFKIKDTPDQAHSVFAYDNKAMEIKHLNEQVDELTDHNSKLKKKIELSKDVLNNYEKTIEKLHRELEYYKIKSSIPDMKQDMQQ
jgi:chromosome segregation ATPase